MCIVPLHVLAHLLHAPHGPDGGMCNSTCDSSLQAFSGLKKWLSKNLRGAALQKSMRNVPPQLRTEAGEKYRENVSKWCKVVQYCINNGQRCQFQLYQKV